MSNTVYLIKLNNNPMAATTDEFIVEALLASSRAKHFAEVLHTYGGDFPTYQKSNRWSRQSLPITDVIDTSPPLAPATHNPNPAKPRGVGQILPEQKQGHRIQRDLAPIHADCKCGHVWSNHHEGETSECEVQGCNCVKYHAIA